MLEHLLKGCLTVSFAGAQLQAEHDQPIEAIGRLRWREIDGDPHSGRDSAVEIDHPLQLIGDEQVTAGGWMAEVGSTFGSAEGSGPT